MQQSDILWLLVCSGLVFLMQPGFMCLESGLTRSKNSINVAIKNLADFGLSVGLFWSFGYALMFGTSLSGLIGSNGFFLNIEGESSLAVFFLFQAMFCSTATTIVSGAVAERMKFKAYLVSTILVSSFIYPIFGHWAWNGVYLGKAAGWLEKLGFVDFAGCSVVHSVGGWVSLAALFVIGPRTGRFPSKGPPRKIHGSNLSLSVLGAMLLWIGWLGFNGGSTLKFNDQVPEIIVHTVIAGVTGMVTTLVLGWRQRKIPEAELLINGSIVGLVSVTASCHIVNTPEAALIGAIGGAVMMLTVYWLERWRIDDAVDAVAVHAGGGVWGTLAVALFGDPELLLTGLTKTNQLLVQLLGIGVCFLWAFGLSWLVLYLTNRFFPLRVTVEEEKVGLNVSQHRAKTEIYELFKAMDFQTQTKDLSLRVPVEPFTEVGLIAERYNQVIDALQEAVMVTEGIVKTATDAIITFTQPQLEILTANPSAEKIFGYSCQQLVGMSVLMLLEWQTNYTDNGDALLDLLLKVGRHELVGRHVDGSRFPLEATVTEAKFRGGSFYTSTFRDISQRKQAEIAIAKANQEITLLNQRLQAENLRLGAELEVTRRLQQMLLPKEEELSQIPSLEIAGFMEPAEEVGGDYYDVLIENGRVKIGIGDVTGHGLESCVLMIMVQTAVRTLLIAQETDPVKFLSILNRTIYENVQRIGSEKNLTLSLLDYQQGQLCLSGQHEEVIVVRTSGRIERIDTIDLGFPVGLEPDISDFVNETRVNLQLGDVVVFYTDGITEAENLQRVQYGIRRLTQVVKRNRQSSALEIKQAVIEDLRQHISEHKLLDDVTLLVLKQK